MHHPFDAASFLSGSATPAEGSFEPRQQEDEGELVGAASSPQRGTRSGVRCQDCRHPAKAHCWRDRGVVCPGHVKTTSDDVPASRPQTTLAVSASTAAVDVEPVPNKRPRRTALPSVAAAAAPTTATSSVDQPIATAAALDRFAREVTMDAVFRRVWLGGGGPAERPEVAYHTTVTIAGHVFRGVLYDVGPHPHSGSSTSAASDTDGASGEGEAASSSLSTAGGSSCLDLALGL